MGMQTTLNKLSFKLFSWFMMQLVRHLCLLLWPKWQLKTWNPNCHFFYFSSFLATVVIYAAVGALVGNICMFYLDIDVYFHDSDQFRPHFAITIVFCPRAQFIAFLLAP